MEMILASAIPSIAAIIIYAMRLHSKKPKPFVHEHIWTPWEEGKTFTRYGDLITALKRDCLDCGLPEHKDYNQTQGYWQKPKG